MIKGRYRKLGKKDKKRARKAARSLPGYMQDVAFDLCKRRRIKGTFGAASPVRRIDPKTGNYIEGESDDA